MLTATSNGMRMGNVVLMGSFGFEGILVCPIDESIPSQGPSWGKDWIGYLNTRNIYDAFKLGLSNIYGIQAY